jgi:hypothetical protein
MSLERKGKRKGVKRIATLGACFVAAAFLSVCGLQYWERTRIGIAEFVCAEDDGDCLLFKTSIPMRRQFPPTSYSAKWGSWIQAAWISKEGKIVDATFKVIDWPTESLGFLARLPDGNQWKFRVTLVQHLVVPLPEREFEIPVRLPFVFESDWLDSAAVKAKQSSRRQSEQ